MSDAPSDARAATPVGDALGLLETSSIAAGVRVADEVLKAAPVELLEAVPVSPGKFLVIFAGGVSEVEAALAAGKRFTGETLLDELFLPRVHPRVGPAISRREPPSSDGEAIGIVEMLSVAAAIVGADAAAKTAAVTLLEIAPGRGIGGKGFFTMTGDVASVEAAAAAARAIAEARGMHLRTEILAGPHPVLAGRVAGRLLRRPSLERFPGEEPA
ncbi:MAG: BMC domain-containing protein [bacterium]